MDRGRARQRKADTEKTIHKAWDWSINKDENWNRPSEDSYYLLERWKKKGFSTFLDLGCGLGRHSLQFSEAGFAASALDLSAEAIESLRAKAARNHLAISAINGDMVSLPYADGSMDCLLAYHVISHSDTEGVAKTIEEIYRVLKAKGEFFLTLCSKSAWSYREAGFPKIDANTVRKTEEGPENGIPHFFADQESIAMLFRRFRIISLRHIQDAIVDGKSYGSWHYYLMGYKP